MTITTDFKKLPPSFLQHRAEFDYAVFFVKLPQGFSYADLFAPEFWENHEKKLQRFDMIRVVSEAEKFDVILTVVNKSFGLKVEFYTGHPPANAVKVA